MLALLMLVLAADPHFTVENRIQVAFVVENRIPAVEAASAPTPMSEVNLALAMLPKPETGFVDFGCGDGRVLIAAAEKPEWAGIPIYGVEIDPARAAVCRERVRSLGLSKRITIITGDCRSMDVNADIFFCYLYSDVLAKLRPKLEKMKAGASYQHPIPGLATTKNGDTFIYVRPVETQTVLVHPQTAEWGGRLYSGRVCSNPGCQMCAEIQRALAATVAVQVPKSEPPKQPMKPAGHYENRQVCHFDSRGRKIGCSIQSVWIPDP